MKLYDENVCEIVRNISCYMSWPPRSYFAIKLEIKMISDNFNFKLFYLCLTMNTLFSTKISLMFSNEVTTILRKYAKVM